MLLGDGFGGFGSATNFATGNNPGSIISADLNADGKIDIATSNYNSNNVSVLLADGTGNFGSAINYTVGNGPSSIISDDFNADGKIDLAIANYVDNNVSILLGDGSGSFGSNTGFTVGTHPKSFVSGDFNVDGKADLAVANNGSLNLSVLLNSLFTVTANATDTVVCAGTSITLSGGGAISYTWTGGVIDGVPFPAPSATTTYTVTGVSLGGCSNTAIKTISINPLPTATFTTQDESSSLFCDGYIKAHITGGTGAIQVQWDSAQTILSNTDSIGSLCPGIYTFHLTDANGCTSIYTKAVQSGAMPPIPPICLITVNSTFTNNVIIWEKTNLNTIAIDSFIVYREITTNSYERIGAVPTDSLSVFEDFASNPAATGYRYKIKSKNTQGVESFFSDYHNTIYLTNTGANFSWTPYQVENSTTPVSTYNVFRDDNSTGNFQIIGNTTGNQFGYTDIDFASYPNAQYYVEAEMTEGVCNPTRSSYAGSRSNVKHFGISGIPHLDNKIVVNIYPNPVDKMLNILGITCKTTLHLYDLLGKLILEKEVENDTSIDTSQIVEGVYTLFTENRNGRTFNKVVISR